MYRKKSILGKVMAGMLSLALLFGMGGNVANADNQPGEEGSEGLDSPINFTSVSSIKIGEELSGKCYFNGSPTNVIPSIGFVPDDGRKFLNTGWGGFEPDYSVSGSVKAVFNQGEAGLSYCSVAINTGVVQAKYYEDLVDCDNNAEPVVTYPITIETPVITTNAEASYYVGERLDFETHLTNTALTGGLILEKKDKSNEFFTYEAKTQILEGQELIIWHHSTSDYDYALTSTEGISFLQAGTVKIKISYTPIWLNNGPLESISETGQTMDDFYHAEEIISINVIDIKKMLTDEITAIEAMGLQAEKYTEASWSPFAEALENAKNVLLNSDSANEDYQKAYDRLSAAKGGLKLVNDDPDQEDNEDDNNNNDDKKDDDTDLKKSGIKPGKDSAAPKTGDARNTVPYLILLGACLIVIVGVVYRKRVR